MMDTNYSSDDSGSESSDTELQKAFTSGKLNAGLVREAPAPKQFTNDVNGLKRKLDEFKKNLDWIQRLDITNDPAPAQPGTEVEGDDDVHNDFKREMKFYRQAQAAVLEGIPRLHKLGIKTKRPEDYFAQMAKSDDHMKKVREKLLSKQLSMDRSEKAKKLRQLKKYGKKVQQEVLQKRQREKKEMLDSVRKYRKGQKDKIDFLGTERQASEKPKQRSKSKGDKKRPNKKRQFKNTKFGFGGQKKRSKYNTAASSADTAVFKSGKKGKGQAQRPGKARRQKMKSRKR